MTQAAFITEGPVDSGKVREWSNNVLSLNGIPRCTPRSSKNTLTKTYSRNKVGLLSSQIANVQLLRSIALSRSLAVALANQDVSSATLIRGQMLEARKTAEAQIMASLQNMRRRSTEHGDFTGCFTGRFC